MPVSHVGFRSAQSSIMTVYFVILGLIACTPKRRWMGIMLAALLPSLLEVFLHIRYWYDMEVVRAELFLVIVNGPAMGLAFAAPLLCLKPSLDQLGDYLAGELFPPKPSKRAPLSARREERTYEIKQ